MASTIPAAFEKFRSNLEITSLQTSTVSTRQQNVRAAVAEGLTVLDDFLTGSYSRNTLIAPLKQADIDVFTVLDASYAGLGPAGLLDKVKRVLLKTYTKTPSISRNGQAITITFTDFIVDVVPAFYRDGGGYRIPNSQGGAWIGTDPKKHVKLSTQHNKAHNNDLVPLVKMLKCWNRNINSYFRSFHLEVLAWDIFTNVTISDFPSGVRYFFDKGRTNINRKNPDPAGYSDDVGYYITSANAADAVSRFETAYNRAIKAEQYAAKGWIEDAIGEWRKIFGDTFPAYG